MVGKFLYAWLSGSAALVALVGTKIDPGLSDEPITGRRVTYQQISGRGAADRLVGPGVLQAARMQIDCWSVGKAGFGHVHDMAAIIIGAPDATTGLATGLNGYRGILGGVTVQSCLLLDERDETDNPEDASENFVQQYSMDFVIRYQR